MRPLALLLSLAALLPAGAQAQQLVEGGMRFTRRNLDILRMSSAATSGLNAAGSAAVAGGTINTGSASSDVYAELNPLTYASDGQAELQMAGNPRQWRQALSLQRATPTGSTEVESKSRSRGHLDQTLKDLLLSQPALVETIVKPNPNDPTKPYVNVQFTSDYEQVVALLGAKQADGPRDPAYDDLKTCQSLSTCGTHVIELTVGVAPQRLGAKASNVSSTSVASTYKAWADGQELKPVLSSSSIASPRLPTMSLILPTFKTPARTRYIRGSPLLASARILTHCPAKVQLSPLLLPTTKPLVPFVHRTVRRCSQ
jgi:hypothetical protein